MIRSPAIRLLLAAFGVGFIALALRDASSAGVAPVITAVGLGVAALGAVAFAPGAVEERPGEREIGGAVRRGTLMVPPRSRTVALGCCALGAGLFLAGMAALILTGDQAPALVAILPAAGALVAIGGGLVALWSLRDPTRLAFVLAPDGLGPLGMANAWVAWDDVREIRVVRTGRSGALAETLRIETADGHHDLNPAAVPGDPRVLRDRFAALRDAAAA